MTCEVDMTDFVDTLDDQVDLALEEGADVMSIAAAMLFSVGQLLVDFMPASEALEMLKTMVVQTGPVLEELQRDLETVH